MKVKHGSILLFLFLLMPFQANSSTDEVDSDFLEFLADMEEVTGEGFENWLETDIEDEINTTSTQDE